MSEIDPNTSAQLAKLRAPFPPNQILTLPKPLRRDAPKGRCPECGQWHGLPAAHISYIGHAALTDRLLDVDPCWTWEPLSVDEQGLPARDALGGLWIKLTVCGVTRLGYGDATNQSGGNGIKEMIGDALRNAAMRFGCGLELWHKGQLHLNEGESPDSDYAPAALQGEPPPEPERAPPPALLTEFEVDDLLLSMRSATTVEQLRDDLRAVWPRATPEQRDTLHAAFDRCKAELPSAPPHSGIGPKMPPPVTPAPRVSRRKPH